MPAHIDEALGLLRELTALAREQAHALEAQSWLRFDELLDQREAILERLGLDGGVGGAALASALATAPDAVRRTALATLTELGELDARHRAVLEAERRAVLEELPGLEAGRRAAAAYGSQRAAAAYVDRAS